MSAYVLASTALRLMTEHFGRVKSHNGWKRRWGRPCKTFTRTLAIHHDCSEHKRLPRVTMRHSGPQRLYDNDDDEFIAKLSSTECRRPSPTSFVSPHDTTMWL